VGLSIVAIVSNTVRLTVVARQDLIHIMRVVGASEGFIRVPFLSEGVLQAFFAGLLALGALYGVTRLVASRFQGVEFLSPAWCGGFLLAAVLLGLVTARFRHRAASEHLRPMTLHHRCALAQDPLPRRVAQFRIPVTRRSEQPGEQTLRERAEEKAKAGPGGGAAGRRSQAFGQGGQALEPRDYLRRRATRTVEAQLRRRRRISWAEEELNTRGS
jgi:hypothetical protein